MARPLRLEHPGALWHITARGNRKQRIFLDETDRRRFLHYLSSIVQSRRWRLHAWVLMPNHYHLLLETPEANLSRGMRDLNGRYSQAFNRRHDRVGHVFQGRFKGILVERESHLLELTRYVVLNPVRAGLVERPDEYRWSSYRDTAGLRRPPAWLEVSWTLRQFGRVSGQARRRYARFVAAGNGCGYRPWEDLAGQIYLGGDAFRQRLSRLPHAQRDAREVPRSQRAPAPRPGCAQVLRAVSQAFESDPTSLREDVSDPGRKAYALLARRLAGAPLRQVAEAMDVTHWAASRLAAKGERLASRDAAFRRALERAETLLRRPQAVKDKT